MSNEVSPATTAIRSDEEFVALMSLSAELGSDPLRTQAAGGNTSLKHNGMLWIKASGTWLADAGRRDIMVPVALAPLRAAIAAGDPRAETATAFVADDPDTPDLRPSVETAVHAVIPFSVVVHIHCVATIAVSVRSDAAALVARQLAGVKGVHAAFVPYVHPGLPLARAITGFAATVNVMVLGNHGLIVAADSVNEAARLVRQVSAALDAPRRAPGGPDLSGLARLAEGTPYRLPHDPLAHDVATDATSLAIAEGGTLYPDHAVFLGSGIAVLHPNRSPAEAERGRPPSGPAPARLLAVPGRGVLRRRDAPNGADALARALAEVGARIPTGINPNYLTRQQETALIGWEAESYRLSLAEARKAVS
jgi:rhamnose utilization protein RhaD (predicted bifunctional aldolase and dehydrogenase)